MFYNYRNNSGHKKKYLNYETLFRTKCIDPIGMLKEKWYDVIKVDDTQYLIRFYSGGAKWYAKSRFSGKWRG